MNCQFYKYQALGNDMIVIDPASFDFPLTSAAIRAMCQRRFGLGADGICFGPLPDAGQPPSMRFFNPDGSESNKTGNGLRIFARYLWDQEYVSSRDFEIGIGGEVVKAHIRDEAAHTIAVRMGRLCFQSEAIPVSGPNREVVEESLAIAGTPYRITAVTIGNPHCVIFYDQLSATVIQAAGPIIETAPHFPQRTNVQFARVVDRHALEIEIWERGAGYTLASGTSASAAAGAAIKTKRCDSPIEVRMPGGAVQVTVDDAWQVTLTGTVEAVGCGYFAEDLVARFGRG